MTGGTYDRSFRAELATASPLTAAICTTAGIMCLSGLAVLVGPEIAVVTATYYVSSVATVLLFWIHGLRTARRM